MRWFALVLTLVGCNQVLGLRDVQPLDAGTDAAAGPCDPLPFDPNRYRPIVFSGGYTWQAARTACGAYGFDLAVLDQNDGAELAMESTAGGPPFWLGVSYGTDWTSLDGCTPELGWASGEPATARPGDCVLRATSGMASVSCTDYVFGFEKINALCETPRPSAQCHAQQAQRDYFVVPGMDTHDGAAAACGMAGGHLVEIDSTPELQDVLGGIAASVPQFWVGATLSNGRWAGPTGCPTIFTWAPNDPTGGDCVMMDSGAMRTYNCGDPNNTAGTICERNM